MTTLFAQAADLTRNYGKALVAPPVVPARVYVLLFNRMVLGVFSGYEVAEDEAVAFVGLQAGRWDRSQHVWLGPQGATVQISTHDVR